jgi:DNA (cytosine-5)-methyltransferase 1
VLVLSLFPGIGLLDMAFEEQGCCVVRGPDVLWGGDVKRFHPPSGRFDGAIGGPPCQAFSRLRHIVEANGYQTAENLIPEFERCMREARPRWFLMENVPAAPEPQVNGYGLWSGILNNRDFGGVQNRERRFSFGVRDAAPVDLWRFIELDALHAAQWEPAVCASGGYRVPGAFGGSGKLKRTHARNLGYVNARTISEGLRLQGLDADFLDKAPFTASGKQRVIGNGVPLPLGRALAAAVCRALSGATP